MQNCFIVSALQHGCCGNPLLEIFTTGGGDKLLQLLEQLSAIKKTCEFVQLMTLCCHLLS